MMQEIIINNKSLFGGGFSNPFGGVGSPKRDGKKKKGNRDAASSSSGSVSSSPSLLSSPSSPLKALATSTTAATATNVRLLGRIHILAIVTVAIVLLMSVIPSEERFLRRNIMYNNIDDNNNNNNNHVFSSKTTTTGGVAKVKSPFILTTNNKDDDDEDSNNDEDDEIDEGLKIAWLMSFPNSGTSYTIKLIRHVAQIKTGTNYGSENRGPAGVSVPVYGGSNQDDDHQQQQPNNNNNNYGPFWSDPMSHPEYTTPKNYVLTKTHCGSRCIKCGPFRYVETTFSFLNACLTGHRVIKKENDNNDNNDADTTNNEVEYVREDGISYPPDRVKKAIHLIRNPFDNIVSRFHLETHRGKQAFGGNFTKDREGFRAFCDQMNMASTEQEMNAVFLRTGGHNNQIDLMSVMRDVPCRADFIRYVQWHNLAFTTTQDLQIDDYVLHYDSYATKFNTTVNELLEYLELDANGAPEPFALGKVYAMDHFTASERQAVRIALHAMSSKTTWEHISRYFDNVE